MGSLSNRKKWCDLGRRALAVGLFAIGLLVGLGQSTALAADTELNIERFEAPPHSGDMMMLRTAEDRLMRSFIGWSGGLFLTYGKDPLRVIDKRFPGKTVFEVVDPNRNFERMSIQVSPNGTDFTQVALLNPSVDTDGQSDEAYTSGGFLQTPTWNAFDLPLPSEIAIAAADSETLWVRVVFHSGDGACNAFRGWMVDNVSVRGNGCD